MIKELLSRKGFITQGWDLLDFDSQNIWSFIAGAERAVSSDSLLMSDFLDNESNGKNNNKQ